MTFSKIIDPYSLILYLISYYYILMAAINDGVTSYSIGVPFALFIVWEILFTKRQHHLKLTNIFILILAISLHFADRSQIKLIYPIVGKSFEIKSPIEYSYGGFFINKIEIFDEHSSRYNNKKKFLLEKGERLYVKRQIHSGNADLGVGYTFEVESPAFKELNNYITDNLDEIKQILSEDYPKGFGGKKTVFYFGDKSKFYIYDNSLSDLFESQNIDQRVHESNRFRTQVTWLSFFPPFCTLVWCICYIIIRGRRIYFAEMDSDKNNPEANGEV